MNYIKMAEDMMVFSLFIALIYIIYLIGYYDFCFFEVCNFKNFETEQTNNLLKELPKVYFFMKGLAILLTLLATIIFIAGVSLSLSLIIIAIYTFLKDRYYE